MSGYSVCFFKMCFYSVCLPISTPYPDLILSCPRCSYASRSGPLTSQTFDTSDAFRAYGQVSDVVLPLSGLDARAAAIVMRTVRNTVNTGRTVVCTIHQPSIDIFESFDELLLLKRGGRTIYAGPLGKDSQDLIRYFKVGFFFSY